MTGGDVQDLLPLGRIYLLYRLSRSISILIVHLGDPFLFNKLYYCLLLLHL